MRALFELFVRSASAAIATPMILALASAYARCFSLSDMSPNSFGGGGRLASSLAVLLEGVVCSGEPP